MSNVSEPRGYCPHDITYGTCVQCFETMRKDRDEFKRDVYCALQTLGEKAKEWASCKELIELRARLDKPEPDVEAYESKIKALEARLDAAEANLKVLRGEVLDTKRERADYKEELTAERAKTQALVEALEEADRHLEFFVHVEKSYKEVGKEKVAFDKCAEIRAAHSVVKQALTAQRAQEGK